MKAKTWITSWLIVVISVLSILGYWVYKIDPFFHYHQPNVNDYFYLLNNQRSQNDGISKYFDYDALITGTSMTENFKTTEADLIFGCNSIKVAYSGGSFKEINDNVKTAIESNENLNLVIRCLDMEHFLDECDAMRFDLGEYPTYLYDDNLLNDVEYLWNRDVIFGRVYQMIIDSDKEGFIPGITTFDDYSMWQDQYSFGIDTVCPNGITTVDIEQIHLTDEEKEIIKKNIELNVTDIADDNPNIDFYYFYSPYSVVVWNEWKTNGTLIKMLEAEAYITELILPHKNIHLFSFNTRTDITTDLNNYKDGYHYGCWINSLMLKWMHDGSYQLTQDNYKDYLKQEYDFYTTFDYSSLDGQVDYEADFFAAALLNKELTGVEPLDVLNNDKVVKYLAGAEYTIDSDGINVAVNCYGSLSRNYNSDTLSDYIRDKEYIGIKFKVNLDDGYNYLSFYGQKIKDHGMLSAYVYDENGNVVGKIEVDYSNLDSEVHQYIIDLSSINGTVTVVLNGGYVDCSGSADSEYQFSNIFMY